MQKNCVRVDGNWMSKGDRVFCLSVQAPATVLDFYHNAGNRIGVAVQIEGKTTQKVVAPWQVRLEGK
jgi:hypothetical protein